MNYLIYLYRLVQYHESAALYSAYSTQWKSNINMVITEWQTLKCRLLPAVSVQCLLNFVFI